jgi:hypothetical protein
MVCRNRTPSEYIIYGFYLYFSGLSLRRASERLLFCQAEPRFHLELDSEIQAKETINQEKKDF